MCGRDSLVRRWIFLWWLKTDFFFLTDSFSGSFPDYFSLSSFDTFLSLPLVLSQNTFFNGSKMNRKNVGQNGLLMKKRRERERKRIMNEGEPLIAK